MISVFILYKTMSKLLHLTACAVDCIYQISWRVFVRSGCSLLCPVRAGVITLKCRESQTDTGAQELRSSGVTVLE